MYTLVTGDELEKHSRALVIHLKKGRKVLSTAHLNGGYREDIEHVMNFDSTPENGSTYCQNSQTYVKDLRRVAKTLDLNDRKTTAISTTVQMEHAAICQESYSDLSVSAIVTAGIAGNAGRVGDPACFHEEEGKIVELVAGTINIILLINLDLHPGAMSRCIVTATEAKTAALQELAAGSVYSQGLATGTGTDETVVVCNGLARNRLMFAGKHSKLGELIGLAVKRGVKESLKKFLNLDAEHQHCVTNRMKRFGFRFEKMLDMYLETEGGAKVQQFSECWKVLERDGALVAKSSLFAHLLDQMSWGLLTIQTVVEECRHLFGDISGEEWNISGSDAKDPIMAQAGLLDAFIATMVQKTCGSFEK